MFWLHLLCTDKENCSQLTAMLSEGVSGRVPPWLCLWECTNSIFSMVLKCAATGWSFTFSLEFTTYVTHNILFVDLVLLVLKSDELVYLLFYCCITIILRIWLFWEQQHLAALLEVPFSCLTSMPNNIQASDKSCLNKTKQQQKGNKNKQQQKGMKTQCSLLPLKRIITHLGVLSEYTILWNTANFIELVLRLLLKEGEEQNGKAILEVYAPS